MSSLTPSTPTSQRAIYGSSPGLATRTPLGTSPLGGAAQKTPSMTPRSPLPDTGSPVVNEEAVRCLPQWTEKLIQTLSPTVTGLPLRPISKALDKKSKDATPSKPFQRISVDAERVPYLESLLMLLLR